MPQNTTHPQGYYQQNAEKIDRAAIFVKRLQHKMRPADLVAPNLITSRHQIKHIVDNQRFRNKSLHSNLRAPVRNIAVDTSRYRKNFGTRHLLSNAAHQLEAVHVGQLQIEHHKIGLRVALTVLNCLIASGNHSNKRLGGAENLFHQQLAQRVVLNNQYTFSL